MPDASACSKKAALFKCHKTGTKNSDFVLQYRCLFCLFHFLQQLLAGHEGGVHVQTSCFVGLRQEGNGIAGLHMVLLLTKACNAGLLVVFLFITILFIASFLSFLLQLYQHLLHGLEFFRGALGCHLFDAHELSDFRIFGRGFGHSEVVLGEELCQNIRRA